MIRIGQFFKGLFTHNLLLKLVSFIIAFLLWSFLMLEKKSEIALNVPIRVENIPADMVITNPPPQDVRVVVRGRRNQLSAMSDRILPYVVDLTGAKPGINTFEVIPAKINLSRGLQIVHVSPAQFDLRLSQAAEKQLPVVVRFRGELPPGYRLVGYTVQPEVIAISAAREELAQLKALETEYIDISPLRGDIEVGVDLDVSDLHILDITTHSVEVNLQVEESVGERTVKAVPVAAPAGWRVVGRQTVNVTLRGPSSILANLTPKEIQAEVTPGRKGGRSRSPVRITVPERVNVIRISPATLEIAP